MNQSTFFGPQVEFCTPYVIRVVVLWYCIIDPQYFYCITLRDVMCMGQLFHKYGINDWHTTPCSTMQGHRRVCGRSLEDGSPVHSAYKFFTYLTQRITSRHAWSRRGSKDLLLIRAFLEVINNPSMKECNSDEEEVVVNSPKNSSLQSETSSWQMMIIQAIERTWRWIKKHPRKMLPAT